MQARIISPLDNFLILNPGVKSTHGERAARLAWMAAEESKNKRICDALKFIESGDVQEGVTVLKRLTNYAAY